MPEMVKPALRTHLAAVRRIHERDLGEGFGRVKLGHASVKTTMIYTHVLNRGGKGVASPADHL